MNYSKFEGMLEARILSMTMACAVTCVPTFSLPLPAQTLKRLSSDFSPEADFKSRSMTKEDFPGRYMYRDYGLQYWEATHSWVKEYLSVCRSSYMIVINVDLPGAISLSDRTVLFYKHLNGCIWSAI